MNISIIIPTLSFPETVHKSFLAILDQSLPPAEIIIVDSSLKKKFWSYVITLALNYLLNTLK